jgi:hypothetical protein
MQNTFGESLANRKIFTESSARAAENAARPLFSAEALHFSLAERPRGGNDSLPGRSVPSALKAQFSSIRETREERIEMKKLFVLTLAAAALALPQQAFAWKNLQFGVGLNLSWQSADNRIGKHFYYNGPTDGGHGYGGFGDFGGPVDAGPGFPPAPQPLPSGHSQNAQPGPAAPFHYSSYQSGNYYQTPNYYYGQDSYYGW